MAKEPIQLAGKVAVITGGAQGIGEETARALVRKGMKVAIGDIDADLAAQTAEELGQGTIALELDVTDRLGFQRFIAEVEEQLGPVYTLINNAGIMPIGIFIEEPDEVASAQINVNVHGVLHGMKAVLPAMIERDSGHLINIASMAGKAGVPGVATYCGTKHFVVGVSEAVWGELRETGVELSYICPGIVNTELTAGVKPTRGVKPVEPTDVAEAIAKTLEFPQPEVMVPGSGKFVHRLGMLLPRRAQVWLGKALKADEIMIDVDDVARAGYVARTTGKRSEDAEKVG